LKQVLLKKGTIYTTDVAKPRLEEGYVLVKTAYSCISAGTEMSGVKSSGTPLVKRVLTSPELMEKGLRMLKERGIQDTWAVVKGKYEVGIAMGYTASGVVEESGSRLFSKGDRVACMGVGYASHAGYLIAPQNLVAKVPEHVPMEHAATAALGCIAMQGVRRADIKLGDYIVIVGMGILGQLAARFAVASGATVFVSDLDERRLEIACKHGVAHAMNATEDCVAKVSALTGGHGADKVIITAATSSNAVISQAFQMCRRKGRVVLVGVAGMNLRREDMYKKELDFVISTSYGPGRYDTDYEENGVDYPYGYVRYTEKRNLESYLRLIDEKKVDINDIIEAVHPAEQADKAYESLKADTNKPLAVLLRYDEAADESPTVMVNQSNYKKPEGVINIALCGAGSFAKGMHIPNIKKMSDKYHLYAVQSRTGANAHALAVKEGCAYSTTDYEKILSDENVDMVMICTRHNLHAQMAIKALEAGKAVFVEKPMAVTLEEMQHVVEAAERSGSPLLVGFNRRFSKYAVEAKKAITDRINPMIISYRMNAGFIPSESWVQSKEGGGRIIGEGCHIIDLFNYLTDSKAESISVNRIAPKTDQILSSDNCVITVKYEDGSVCTLTYTGQGNKGYGKEFLEIFYDGKVIAVDDYKSMRGYGVHIGNLKSAGPEKGQFEELQAYYHAIKDGDGYPIPLWQLEQATRISILAQEYIE